MLRESRNRCPKFIELKINIIPHSRRAAAVSEDDAASLSDTSSSEDEDLGERNFATAIIIPQPCLSGKPRVPGFDEGSCKWDGRDSGSSEGSENTQRLSVRLASRRNTSLSQISEMLPKTTMAGVAGSTEAGQQFMSAAGNENNCLPAHEILDRCSFPIFGQNASGDCEIQPLPGDFTR